MFLKYICPHVIHLSLFRSTIIPIFSWYRQACPILTTCSSRESGDSTRTVVRVVKQWLQVVRFVQVVIWYFSVK